VRPDFWSMGGYGAYVWPSYALFAVVLVWNIASALRSHARMRSAAERRLRMAAADGAASTARKGTP
jgi:heme exporter protein CcmD